MNDELLTIKFAPSFLLSSKAKRTITVFERNDGIGNDGILVFRTTNNERRDKKGADKCIYHRNGQLYATPVADLLLAAAHPEIILTQPALL
jgi:hypothetical protein